MIERVQTGDGSEVVRCTSRRKTWGKREGADLHAGAIGELLACTWLMAKGYEVFRNVSAVGPADIVAVHRKTGAVHKFDVKKAKNKSSKSNCVLSPEQMDMGVEALFVDCETGECLIPGVEL